MTRDALLARAAALLLTAGCDVSISGTHRTGPETSKWDEMKAAVLQWLTRALGKARAR